MSKVNEVLQHITTEDVEGKKPEPVHLPSDEERWKEFVEEYSHSGYLVQFIIAFVQIAPMLYSALIGEYNNLKIWPIVVMIVLVVVAIFFIVRKG